MITDQLAVILRTAMIFMALLGFSVGMIPCLAGDTTIYWALFCASVLALACALITRALLMSMFRAYIVQMQLQAQRKREESANPPKS
jgi:hypothetical protein